MKTHSYYTESIFNKMIVLFTVLILSSVVSAGTNDEVKNNLLLIKGQSVSYNDYIGQKTEPVDGYNSLLNKIGYPKIPQLAQIDGKVVVRIFVNESGAVDALKLIEKSGCGYDEAVVNGLSQVKFKPVFKDGNPVKTRFLLTVNFKTKPG